MVRWPLLLILAAGLAASVPNHSNYDLTEPDPSAIDRLYQALVHNVVDSLAFSLQERFGDASAALADYQRFVAQLSAFRSDLSSRGLGALVLDSRYSTEPFVPLGRDAQAIVEDQRVLVANIMAAQNAAEGNRTEDMRAAILAARADAGKFVSSIQRLNSSARSMPQFLEKDRLYETVAQLWELAARYASSITSIEKGDTIRKGTMETRIELMAAPLRVKTGGEVQFWGTLATAEGSGLGNETISISFLSSSTKVKTMTNGSYAVRWQIGLDIAPDVYPAQAAFEPSGSSNLSGCRSEVLNITVDSPKMRSHLDITTSSPRCRLGTDLEVWGRLYTDWGEGLAGRVITIVSANLTAELIVRTDSNGAYRTTLKPVAPGFLVLRSGFAGDDQYLGSTSLAVEVNVTPTILGTAVDLITPNRVVAGKLMRISGRVRDQNGVGLGLVWVSLEWDGARLRSTTTDWDGSFVLQLPAPRDARGSHALEAVFESQDPGYLSSRSGKREVEVSPPMPLTLPVAIALSIAVLLFGLAAARKRRLPRARARRMQVPFGTPPGPQPIPPSPPTVGRLPPKLEETMSRAPAFVGRGREALIGAYAQFIGLISSLLSLDLTSMTHTEILSLLLERRPSEPARSAAASVTRIYEKAAYSGLDPAESDQNEFRRNLEVLVASLETTEVG